MIVIIIMNLYNCTSTTIFF